MSVAIAMDSCLERILAEVPQRTPCFAAYGNLSLTSRYQPIFCAAGQSIHGYEGLLAVADAAGHHVPVPRLFERIAGAPDRIYLDWLARALHLSGFARLGEDRGKLFLNVTPDAAIEDARYASVFVTLLSHYGVRPQEVVVEILESGVDEEKQLADAVGLYRSLGCAVALDDFGAGVSEMERVWRLQPDIVKVDRAVLRAGARDGHAARVLKSVVRMMHDCGARVVIEGVEDRQEALLALETNADFLQGFYFARPSPVRVDPRGARALLEDLVPGARRAAPCPHADAVEATAMALETGASFAEAAELLLHQPSVLRGYLVAPDGRVIAGGFQRGPIRGSPLAERGAPALGLGWSVQRLVRQAGEDRGVVLRSQPHVAVGGLGRCTTFGYGFRYEGDVAVLCADVAFD